MKNQTPAHSQHLISLAPKSRKLLLVSSSTSTVGCDFDIIQDMRVLVSVFTLVSAANLAHGFLVPQTNQCRPTSLKPMTSTKILSLQRERRSSLEMVVRMEVPENPPLSLYEVFAPPLLDRTMITWMLGGQALLLAAGIALGAGFGVDVLHSNALEFDIPAAQMASVYGLGLSAAGFIMDALPLPYFQDVYRDTKYFVLRLLGRNSGPVSVLFAALLVSAGAAIAEEVFFRGFCFNAFAGTFSPWVALVASSALFGVAHFPVFGANAALEAVIGGVMGYAYMQSGYNIAVPIMLHFLYDFLTMFRTWAVSSKDLKERLLEATEYQIARASNKDQSKIKQLSKAVFDFIDSDKDGKIDVKELAHALHLFSEKSRSFAQQRELSQDLFVKLDSDCDGFISADEFATLMREEEGRPVWLVKAAAVTEREQNLW